MLGQKRDDIDMINEYEIDADFPNNVDFILGNIVSDEFMNDLNNELKHQNTKAGENPVESFDTVVCLSLTKWVHMNWGDNGIYNMFANISKCLKVGGTLILESQPWKSYKKNKGMCAKTKEVYEKIELKPDSFDTLLIEKFGFALQNVINTDNEEFKRDLKVFSKIR